MLKSKMRLQSQSHLQPWKHFNKRSSQFSPMMFAVFLLLASLDVIKSQFLVKTLPGLDGDLPFSLETGYIGVGESDDEQLFYYFIESEGNPEDDPLMIWLTGGPGCSSISGLMFEIGPVTLDYEISTLEKPILKLVPYSWTKVANIISLDQPAGTGFSYAKSPESYITNDTLSAKMAYSFLRKWLVDHPKFLSNPLYIGGSSYGGKMVPRIVQEIYDGTPKDFYFLFPSFARNEIGEDPQMNIKGYTAGNPFTDTSGDYNSRIPFANHMALLSDAIYKSAKENCGGEYLNINPKNSLCIHDIQVVDKCLERIQFSQILEPFYDTSNTLKCNPLRRDLGGLDKTSLDTFSLPQVQKRWCLEDKNVYTAAWANRKDVREALHIHEEFNNMEWVRCNKSFEHSFFTETPSYAHNVLSVIGYHRHFADKKCRALVYSGDHDMVIPYLGTLKWIQSLNLPVVDDWRPWFVDEQVAGYTMKYTNGNYSLTFATVKGGSHTAAENKPKECLNTFMRWLANDTL